MLKHFLFCVICFLGNLNAMGNEKIVNNKWDYLVDCDKCIIGVVKNAHIKEYKEEGNKVYCIIYSVIPIKDLLGMPEDTKIVEIIRNKKWLDKKIPENILKDINVIDQKMLFLVNTRQGSFIEQFAFTPMSGQSWDEFIKPFEEKAEKIKHIRALNFDIDLPNKVKINEPFLCTLNIKNINNEEIRINGFSEAHIKLFESTIPKSIEFDLFEVSKRSLESKLEIIILYSNFKQVVDENILKIDNSGYKKIKFILMIREKVNLGQLKKEKIFSNLYIYDEKGVMQLRIMLKELEVEESLMSKRDLEFIDFFSSNNLWHLVDGSLELKNKEETFEFLNSAVDSLNNLKLREYLVCFMTFNGYFPKNKMRECLKIIADKKLFGFDELARSALEKK